jgi:hypothetical protein
MPERISKSTRTTANEPVAAIDPGGTRPNRSKGKPDQKTEQKVVSGDRNDHKTSKITSDKSPS